MSDAPCTRVVLLPDGTRVCEDTGIVLEDEPVYPGPRPVYEHVERIQAKPATLGGRVYTVVRGDETLARRNAELVRRETELEVRVARMASQLGFSDPEVARLALRYISEMRRRGWRHVTDRRVAGAVLAAAASLGYHVEWWRDPYARSILSTVGKVTRSYRREAVADAAEIVSRLKLPLVVLRVAKAILEELLDGHNPGHKPRTLAAAAVYVAAAATGNHVPEQTVAKTAGCSDMALRNALKTILENVDIIVKLG